MNNPFYMGIDPGNSGAIAVLDSKGEHDPVLQKLSDTESEISFFMSAWVIDVNFCYLERVASMPKQGVASSFKFGTSYGFLRGLLIAHNVPFETVPPGTWQAKMRCKTGGDKNITKSFAQQLFPGIKITHATADALIIAEYTRRVKCGELA